MGNVDGLGFSESWRIWFLVIETLGIVEAVVFFTKMIPFTNRSPQADRYQKKIQNTKAEKLPTVDVFIPTLDEKKPILEKSIIGSRALNYPNLNVWILDDGCRDWLKDYCDEKEVGYIPREESTDAKAGNLNNAMKYTDGDLITIFDADFVPQKDFLQRTVGFFENDEVGIVQTPQHFYNPDPIQNNLLLYDSWPDEQRLFFDVIQPGLDGWDAAMCCGSCSIARRSDIEDIGGFPTESITEDYLTSLKLLRKGKVTRYLNERLSQGLAPETTEAFNTQRKRWMQGSLQILYLKDGPLGPGLSLIHRIMFFPFYWIDFSFFYLTMMLAPILFLTTGIVPYEIPNIPEYLSYQGGMLFASYFIMNWMAPKRYRVLPAVMTEFYKSIQLFPVLIQTLIDPFGKGFEVTPKGLKKGSIDWLTLIIASTGFLICFVWLFFTRMPYFSNGFNRIFLPVGIFWSFFELMILSLVMMMCFNKARPRVEERFEINEKVSVVFEGETKSCEIKDMSLAGAMLEFDERVDARGKRILIKVSEIMSFPAEVVYTDDKQVAIEFKAQTTEQKDQMIEYLFTNPFTPTEYGEADSTTIYKRLFNRAFGTASP